MKLEDGGYVFDGEIETEGKYYGRGNFISKEKTIVAKKSSVILKFEEIVGLKFEDTRISHVNEVD